jgi:hypothetical protein
MKPKLALAPKRKPRGKPFAKGNKIGPRYKKGESGNPSGLPGVNISERIARTALAEYETETVKGLGKKLSKGDVSVFQALSDRADGRVVQKQEITGGNGGPIEHTIRFGDGANES